MGFAAAPHKEPRLELVAAFIQEAEPRLCGFKRLRVRPSQNTPSHRPCAQMELRRPNKARRRRLQAPRGGAWMRCCPAPRRLARLPSSYRARLRPPAATGARPSGERRLLLRAASLPPHCDRAASGDCSTPTSARPPFPEGSKLASQHPLVVTVALADGDTQAVRLQQVHATRRARRPPRRQRLPLRDHPPQRPQGQPLLRRRGTSPSSTSQACCLLAFSSFLLNNTA